MTRVKAVFKKSIKYILLLIVAAYTIGVADNYQAVIDGDTLKIGRQTIRLNGIDAPELRQKCLCGGKTVKCGIQAKRELYRMIDSKTVLCEATQRDYYGRLIAECFIERGGKKISLNAMMIKKGFAMASRYNPDFLILESEALRTRQGFWKCEFFQDPASFRKPD